MAWTQIKQDLLKELLTERVKVEQSPETVLEWGFTEGWMQILNSYVTDVIKQNVLNDLIDDKVAYLQSIQANNTSENASLQTTIDQGLALKETV